MRQSNSGTHGNGVAAKQGQFHARLTLGDAVTHGRHTASHLHGSTVLGRLMANNIRVVYVGLMR